MEKAVINKIELEKIEVHSIDELQSRIEVTLSLNNRSETIEKTSSNNEEAILTAIGLATLDIVNLLISRPLDCQINYIKQVEAKTNTPPSIHCLLRLRESGKESLLSGSAFINKSLYEATTRSILGTLSATLERLIELQQKREKINRSGSFPPVDLATVNAISKTENTEEINQKTNPSVNLVTEETNKEISDRIDVPEKMPGINKAKELFEQGEALVRKGSYQQAASLLKEAVKLDSQNADYHCQLGLSLANISITDEAEVALLKAVELAPNIALYKTELGLFYKECGKIEKAQKFLEEAISLDSADARAKRALANVKELSLTFSSLGESSNRPKTGSFAKVELASSVDDVSQKSFLKKTVTPKLLVKVISGILGFIIVIFLGIYTYNYLTIYFRKPPKEEELYPRNIAIKIVKDFPSDKGGTIEDRINKYLQEQKIKDHTWISSPENKTKRFIVVLAFTKDGKSQKGVWTVDLEKKICNAENPLAKQF